MSDLIPSTYYKIDVLFSATTLLKLNAIARSKGIKRSEALFKLIESEHEKLVENSMQQQINQ